VAKWRVVKLKNRVGILAVLLLLGVAFASNTGNSGVNVTVETPPMACGDTLSANSTYIMTQNASINGTSCFDIAAINVTLDCAGYSIIGDGTASTDGVKIEANAATVKNCIISNFADGVHVTAVSDAVIQNNTIDATAIGIAFSGSSAPNVTSNNVTSAGIGMDGSSVSSLNAANNSITATGSSNAIHMAGADNNIGGNNLTANTGVVMLVYVNGEVYTNAFVIHNNKFVSSGGASTLLQFTVGSASNMNHQIYGNNFTATSGSYVISINPDTYVHSVDGHNEGNIYANVEDGTITVRGTVNSTYAPGYFVGSTGAVPYTSSNSGGKISGSASDGVPLTPFTTFAPIVESVTMTNSSLDPTPCSTTSVPVIQMNVSDGNGYADITTASAYINISKGGVAHQSATCVEDSHDTNWILLNCTGASMDFYDVAAADWAVVGYAIDTDSMSNTTTGSAMTYNTGIHMVLENDPLTFGTIYSGTENNTNTNTPALDVKNCGNAALNMTITGANITDSGLTNSIPVGSFRVSDNGTSGAGTELTLTETAQGYSIGASGLAAGSNSTKALYSLLNVPVGQTAATYDTGTWAFIVSNYE
jgi:parallel beta-helix repeat protein